jgi:hypothetical protein
MSEDQAGYTEIGLLAILSSDQIQMLTKILVDLRDDSGYGAVKIVMVDKRIVNLKVEKSYDFRPNV